MTLICIKLIKVRITSAMMYLTVPPVSNNCDEFYTCRMFFFIICTVTVCCCFILATMISECFVVIITIVAVVLSYIVPMTCPVPCFPVVLLLLVLSYSGFLSSLAVSTLPLLLVACIIHLVLMSSLSMMFVTILNPDKLVCTSPRFFTKIQTFR